MSGWRKSSSSSSGAKNKKEGKKDSSKKDASQLMDFIDGTQLRHPAIYCAPHIKVPGVITVSASSLVRFEPDASNEHVREVGVHQYQVCIEIGDVLECGAVAMPVEATASRLGQETMAYFLQLHVRTLDGVKCCVPEAGTNTLRGWCVVFRLESREILHQVTLHILDFLEVAKREASSVASQVGGAPARARSSTSVPFPCLDCVAEMEAMSTRQRHERQQALKGRVNASTAGSKEGAAARLQLAAAKKEESDSDSDRDLGVVLKPGNVLRPLLTENLACGLFEYLPIGVRIEGAVEWVLRYTPKAHGVSLKSLYRSVGQFRRTLVLVQDTEDHIFGGYAPESWEPTPRFYGSGEAFVFSFGFVDKNLPLPTAQIFPWSTKNSYFMHSDDSGVAMGGGNGSHAFFLASDLLRGVSGPTDTFGNTTLASTSEFVVKDLEIWAFEEV